MTFKKYLVRASNRNIYDDGNDFDFEAIFAREVLRYAHDKELEKIMNAEPWFIALACSIYQDYEKSSKDAR